MGITAGPELHAERFEHEPQVLREVLEEAGVFTLEAYPSGLYPASDLTPALREATGMGMAWLRDSAQVAAAQEVAGRTDAAIATARAFLHILHNQEDTLDAVVSGRDPSQRLPVRVNGNTLEPDIEGRHQNDATGYALWFVSWLANRGRLALDANDVAILKQTGRYLLKIEFWNDLDQGHWEEDDRLHASSIGVAMAGLRHFRQMFYKRDANDAIAYDVQVGLSKGREKFNAILASGVTDWPTADGPAPTAKGFDIQRRADDAALLFLLEPLRMLSDATARRVIGGVRANLLRPHGIARYAGDTYWGPDFPETMPIEERTTYAEGRLEKRNARANQIAADRTEAQWPLFDPVIAEAASYRSQRRLEIKHLNRTLAQLVPTPQGLGLPEALYLNTRTGTWQPNTHTPLLWPNARLMSALVAFEQTRGYVAR